MKADVPLKRSAKRGVAHTVCDVPLRDGQRCWFTGRFAGRCAHHHRLSEQDIAEREQDIALATAEREHREAQEALPPACHFIWRHHRPTAGMSFLCWQSVASYVPYRGVWWLQSLPALSEAIDRLVRLSEKARDERDRQAILEYQGGNWCAICGATDLQCPTVNDHCHKTGLLRGVLCRRCNAESDARFGAYARLPPSVLCGATEPYEGGRWRGRASVEPWVERQLGPLPESAAERALYLARAQTLFNQRSDLL